ncbi:hypothetical protein GOBAR_DD18962 [Gossypium barbadense]|nr:hypothetical protein GOBAR_DD18962 [Gossypium barbadense]
MASPPPLLYGVIGGPVASSENNSSERSHSSSSSIESAKPSRFFTGSSRRSDIAGVVTADYDVEANRIGEEISEMFRWFSGV